MPISVLEVERDVDVEETEDEVEERDDVRVGWLGAEARVSVDDVSELARERYDVGEEGFDEECWGEETGLSSCASRRSNSCAKRRSDVRRASGGLDGGVGRDVGGCRYGILAIVMEVWMFFLGCTRC